MMHTIKRSTRSDSPIVYMEVYGVNRVLYRVTIGTVKRRGRLVKVYGVVLEDVRTGQRETLENFSEDLNHTVQFANSLIHRKIRPCGLYNEALRQLRYSSAGSILPVS
ncbi:MAG: hypothetical protein IJ496_08995 [Ruminococcus sp.]|nr:hypothetical protein [Ruminococcus sp.]